ncbi:MAG TPA: hypothetical protein VF477_23550, partial [Mycobacterium sp.]
MTAESTATVPRRPLQAPSIPDLVRHPLTVAALASVLAALAGVGFVLAAGVSPGAAGSALWDGMFGTD